MLTVLAGSAKGKAKDKEAGVRQTTLFGLPAVSQPDKKAAPTKKKKAADESQTQDSQATVIDSQTEETQGSQATDVVMVNDTQVSEEPSGAGDEDEEEPIEWPESPERGTSALPEVEVAA